MDTKRLRPKGEKIKVILFVGTRPEAIKIAPIVNEFKSRPDIFDTCLCSTGQHREMLTQTLKDYNLEPDASLDVMMANQSLAGISSQLFKTIDNYLSQEKPDFIVVQGDTTSVQVASLCAFYQKIPVAHIEAGLRTWDIMNPFPEELNRRVTGLVSHWHFAPTELAKKNLLADKVDEHQIFVTGNTVIDALLHIRTIIRKDVPQLSDRVEEAIRENRQIILITSHRRESFGAGLERICDSISQLAHELPETRLIYPVHLNPNVRGLVFERLGNIPNVFLEEPLAHKSFVRLMEASKLILSDSGGIQEEAPSLGKPVLVMRDTTERPEGIDSGVNMLVGTDSKKIVSETMRLLNDSTRYEMMSNKPNPYGDGLASKRIVDLIQKSFNK